MSPLFVPMKELPVWYEGEEVANALSHMPGIFLSLGGIYLLYQKSSRKYEFWRFFSFMVFGLSLLSMFTASTIYHVATNYSLKMLLRYLDHISIYFVIAGSFTPFALTVLRGSCGWWIFGLMWGFAFIGMLLKIFRFDDFDDYSILYFLGLGSIGLLALKQLFLTVSKGCIFSLLFGALMYVAGIPYYVNTEKYSHVIWHLFVMSASAIHILTVLFFL